MGTMEMVKPYSKGSTLVLGEPQTGRTSWVIKELSGKKVLWISFNNLGVIADAETFAKGSKLILVNDYKADIPTVGASSETTFTVSKDLKFDAIVLDGLNYATGMWFTANIGARQPTQQEWGVMSNGMSELILKYREIAPVYCITDVEKDAEGKNQVALNRAAYQGIVGLFDKKVRTIVKDKVTPIAATKDTPASVGRTKVYEVLTGADALNI